MLLSTQFVTLLLPLLYGDFHYHHRNASTPCARGYNGNHYYIQVFKKDRAERSIDKYFGEFS